MNIDLVDCGITEFGFEQCKGAKEIMDKIKVDIVLVSPLLRAI